RGGPGRRGRLLAVGMTRVEDAMDWAVDEWTDRLAPALRRGLVALADLGVTLARRVRGARRPSAAGAAAPPAEGAGARVAREAQAPGAAQVEEPVGRAEAPAGPWEERGATPVDGDGARLPASVRDRLAG
ncbi:hypothetical protein WDV86_16135, partial [Pseudokineococcus sp. 1T1Z-3]|uniref:hypothetical protein n=1 Tax=Pseudokineococcus sp. 1T1Z-3 TaxID=3132745 RepID=UPI0030A3D8CC